MIDTSAINAEIRARARAEVAAFNFDDIADSLPEQISAVTTVPALYVMVRRVSGMEQSPGMRTQSVELEVLVGIVCGSIAGTNAALKGTKSIEALSGATLRALHWWEPPAASPGTSGSKRKLKFRGEDDPVRDGSRIAIQQRFAITVNETYS